MKILKAERGSRLLYIGVGRFTQRIYELPDMKVRISGFCAMRTASLDDRARCLEIDLEINRSAHHRSPMMCRWRLVWVRLGLASNSKI
jgi:hypothetical protein